MTILEFLETGLVAGLAFAAIDLVWLTTVAKKFYYDNLGDLLRAKAEPVSAVLFYLMYIVGICYFAIAPALHAGSWSYALTHGALFGLFTYGTYDLTNLATLKGWSRKVAIADMIWGTVLSGSVATLTYIVIHNVL